MPEQLPESPAPEGALTPEAPAPKKSKRRVRSPAERDRHRRAIIRLHSLNLTQREIAERLGISQGLVNLTLKELGEGYFKSLARAEIAEVKGRQLFTVREELGTALDAWRVTLDPRILAQVIALLKREADLLGLDATKKTQVEVTMGDLREFVELIFQTLATLQINEEVARELSSATPGEPLEIQAPLFLDSVVSALNAKLDQQILEESN